jgi:hypothetical protein
MNTEAPALEGRIVSMWQEQGEERAGQHWSSLVSQEGNCGGNVCGPSQLWTNNDSWTGIILINTQMSVRYGKSTVWV